MPAEFVLTASSGFYAQVIHIVNRSHHLAVVKCEATNDIGSNEASMVLKVKCKTTHLFEKVSRI